MSEKSASLNNIKAAEMVHHLLFLFTGMVPEESIGSQQRVMNNPRLKQVGSPVAVAMPNMVDIIKTDQNSLLALGMQLLIWWMHSFQYPS
jgi:hypothetical protein